MKTFLKSFFKVFGIIIVIIIAIILLIWMLLIRAGRLRDKNYRLTNEYPVKIQEYLEEKYGQLFVINLKYEARPSGPIPGDTDAPFVYEVTEVGEDEYVFRVYVYPESAADKNIKYITDGYCWKFIGPETKKYLLEEIKEILPSEYKAILLPNWSITFDKNILPDSMIRTAFNKVDSGLSLNLFIITPPTEQMDVKCFTDKKLYNILYEFYKNYISTANGGFTFYHYETETYDDYLKINENEIEGKVFRHEKTWPVYLLKRAELEFGYN